MKTNILYILLLITSFAFAQVRVVESPNNAAALSSSAFIDASSHPIRNGTDNLGKGLIFPRADLTTFTFSGAPVGVPSSYPTRFDGMIVYNTATGVTPASGSGVGGETVTPGFYYFKNPTAASIASNGNWIPLGTDAAVAIGLHKGTGAPTPTDPADPDGGDIYVDESTGDLYTYNSTTDTWVNQSEGALVIDSDGDTQIQVEEGADDDTIRFDTAGTERAVISNTGNVGIGTAPTAKLDVNGEARVRTLPTGAATDQVVTADTNGNLRKIALSSVGTDNQNIANLAVNATSNVLTVGIEDGTSQTVDLSHLDDSGTDNQNLSVGAGTINTSIIAIEDGTDVTLNAGSGISLAEAGNIITINSQATNLADADGDTQIQVEETADDDTIRFDTAGTERAVITNTGDVGIGTTPTAKLDVNGTTRLRGALHDGANSAGTAGQVLSSTATGLSWIDNSTLADGTQKGNTLFWDSANWSENQNVFIDSDAVFFNGTPTPVFESRVTSATPPYLFAGEDLERFGDKLYYVNLSRGLEVFDITNPSSPTYVVSGLDRHLNPNLDPDNLFVHGIVGLFVKGNYIYLSFHQDDFLTIIDNSVPGSPVKIGDVDLNMNYAGGFSLVVEGDYAYIGYRNSDVIVVVNVSNPANPTYHGQLTNAASGGLLDGVYDIKLKGGYAYVLSENSDALVVLDISTTPGSPTVVGSLSNANLDGAKEMTVRGDYAYVVSSNANTLSIIDISDPTTPTEVGVLTDGTGGAELSGAYDIEMQGPYAFVTAPGGDALEIIDVSNPAAPTHSAKLLHGAGGVQLNAGDKLFVSVKGNYAYVYNGATALEVIKLGDLELGAVGINTTTPTHTLSVNGTAGKTGGGTWAGFSDQRVKKNIHNYNKGLKEILQIRPVVFNYTANSGYDDTQTDFVGILAQEIEQVLPNTVTVYDDSKGSSGLSDKRQFDSSEILWTLVNAVKELKAENEKLQARIKALEEK